MSKLLAVMSDLFFSVKINDAAKKLGLTAEFVKDKALALEKAKAKPPLIILDLNCDAAHPLDLITGIKGDPDTAGIPIIGFVSHVQADLKRQAQRLGCDIVVARSVFAQDLSAILERYLAMPDQFNLGQQPIIAFVATRDADGAKKFYRDTLGLSLLDESPFALVFDAHGTMIRVTPVKDLIPAGYTVLGWHVPDIFAAANALKKAGVRFERYEGMQQDELGIWTVPGGGAKVAWFKDPDGNTLSISEH